MKKYNSLRFKILSQNSIIIVVFTLIILYLIPSIQYNSAIDTARSQINIVETILSYTIKDQLEFLDKESADIHLNSVAGLNSIDFIAVYDKRKELFTFLNDSAYDTFLFENPNFFKDISEKKVSIIDDQIVSFSHVINNSTEELLGYLLISFNISEINNSIRNTRNLMLIIALVAVIITLSLSFYSSRKITEPVVKLINFFKKMADGEGNLSERLDDRSKDEFGVLAKEFNRFIGTQNYLISDIKNLSTVLIQKSDEIEKLSTNVNELIKDLFASLDSILETVNNLDESANNNVESAKQATNQSEETISISLKSQRAVEKSIYEMNSIKDEMIELESGMRKLQNRSQEIDTISTTLKDITDRTTILALNTSIEANKAGQHGISFQVIAEEIQSLSEQGTDSLESINHLIKSIENSLKQSFDLTLSCSTRVEKGMEIIGETGERILFSVDKTRENLKHVENLYNKANEQKERIQTIVNDVINSTMNITSIRNSIDNTINRLNEQKGFIGKLSEQVSQFNIEEY